MLSVVEISKRIQDPYLVIPEDLSTLQELSDKYPYTQLFSILYLKALSKAGDPRFEEELSRHSFRISDRVQLYHLIEEHGSSDSTPTKTAEVPEEKINLEEAQDVVLEKTSVNETEEIQNETVEEAPFVIEEVVEEVLEEVKEETKVESTELVTDTESGAKTEEVIEAKDKLDETILHHVYAANYHLEDLTDEEQEKLDSKEEEPKKEIEETEEISENTASSFTNWLHSNNNYTERDTSDKEAINAVVEDFSEFDPSSDLFGEVEKPKTEFFSPTKKAKESLEENELPVSETLAKIYIMQGNYPQAISAYKQLSLAFPEKKIFFANLIEDLEKKINT